MNIRTIAMLTVATLAISASLAGAEESDSDSIEIAGYEVTYEPVEVDGPAVSVPYIPAPSLLEDVEFPEEVVGPIDRELIESLDENVPYRLVSGPDAIDNDSWLCAYDKGTYTDVSRSGDDNVVLTDENNNMVMFVATNAQRSGIPGGTDTSKASLARGISLNLHLFDDSHIESFQVYGVWAWAGDARTDANDGTFLGFTYAKGYAEARAFLDFAVERGTGNVVYGDSVTDDVIWILNLDGGIEDDVVDESGVEYTGVIPWGGEDEMNAYGTLSNYSRVQVEAGASGKSLVDFLPNRSDALDPEEEGAVLDRILVVYNLDGVALGGCGAG